jgi:hypothetical protein
MSSEKIHADITASDANKDPVIENNESKASDSKLLKFDDNAVSPGKDINTKISALDTDLAHLRAELGSINSSVEEGLDRLGDTDTDLTAKVSETYKRLGEIDNSYRSLLDISSRIDTDIQRLNGDVSTVAEQSATGIKTLEQSTIARSTEFAQKNQQVVTKVNHLVETSKLTGELLSQKIETTTKKMLQMETHVIAEIESLSSATKDKTKTIENSVESNKAKILKLQSVDEAIIKRATTLEISSAELSVKSQDIQSSVKELQQSTGHLSDGINELSEQTRALEDITNNHGLLINSLQKATSGITDRLSILADRESKHFNIFTGSFLLLLIATAVIYFSQQSQFNIADTKISERNEIVDSEIVILQQAQMSSAAAANESLVELESKVAELNIAMQEEVSKEIALVDHKMKNMQDQVRSVDARLTSDSPFSQIGNDNIIHGAQWIAQLPSQNFTVQLAFVDDINTMYELAQRYNYYLNNSLSYFEVNSGNGKSKYVLLSGNYATQQQAVLQIRSMPGYIAMQRPIVKSLDDVQKYIAQK